MRAQPSTVRVAPFGHLRIEACLQLPAAFRSLPRPSSSPEATGILRSLLFASLMLCTLLSTLLSNFFSESFQTSQSSMIFEIVVPNILYYRLSFLYLLFSLKISINYPLFKGIAKIHIFSNMPNNCRFFSKKRRTRIRMRLLW